MTEQPGYIEGAGACLATKNVLRGAGIAWLERAEPRDPVDNGWRFMSAIDSSAYLSNPDSWEIVDFNAIVQLEPAVLAVWDMPIGSDLRLCQDANGYYFVDDETGRRIPDTELHPS